MINRKRSFIILFLVFVLATTIFICPVYAAGNTSKTVIVNTDGVNTGIVSKDYPIYLNIDDNTPITIQGLIANPSFKLLIDLGDSTSAYYIKGFEDILYISRQDVLCGDLFLEFAKENPTSPKLIEPIAICSYRSGFTPDIKITTSTMKYNLPDSLYMLVGYILRIANTLFVVATNTVNFFVSQPLALIVFIISIFALAISLFKRLTPGV